MSPNLRSRLRFVGTEGGALVLQTALGAIALWHLVSTPRSWMLFDDGDSVLLAIVRRATEAGPPTEFGWSAVLFVPERLLYDVLSALTGLSPQATLALNAVVNLVLFGLASRFLVAPALRAASHTVRAMSGVVPVALLCALVLTESSAARASGELASLLMLTTYYSATAWGVLVILGILVRLHRASTARRRVVTSAALIGVVGVSVWTNMIVLLWLVVPATVVWCVFVVRPLWPALRRGRLPRGLVARALVVPGIVAVETAVVVVMRDTVTASGYARAWDVSAGAALAAFAHALGDRFGSVEGALSVALWCVVWVASLVAALWMLSAPRGRREDRTELALVAVSASAPLLCGIFVLGTLNLRYLQPVVFLPLAVAPVTLRVVGRAVRRRSGRSGAVARLPRTAACMSWVIGAAVVVTAVAALPHVARASSAVPKDIACVVAWADATDRTGAGDFWAIRGVKYRLDDPGHLVQLSERLVADGSLVDKRESAGVHEVSWVVVGPGAPAGTPEYAGDASPGLPLSAYVRAAGGVEPQRTQTCGRLLIADWGSPVVRIGGTRR